MPDARQEVARRLKAALADRGPDERKLALQRWRDYCAKRAPLKIHDPNVFVAALRWITTEEDPGPLAQGYAVTALALQRAAQDLRAALNLAAPVTVVRLTDAPDPALTAPASLAAPAPAPSAAPHADEGHQDLHSDEALDVLVADPESAARTAQLLRLLRLAQAQGKTQQLLAHAELPPLLRALLEDPTLAAQLEARLGL